MTSDRNSLALMSFSWVVVTTAGELFAGVRLIFCEYSIWSSSYPATSRIRDAVPHAAAVGDVDSDLKFPHCRTFVPMDELYSMSIGQSGLMSSTCSVAMKSNSLSCVRSWKSKWSSCVLRLAPLASCVAFVSFMNQHLGAFFFCTQ